MTRSGGAILALALFGPAGCPSRDSGGPAAVPPTDAPAASEAAPKSAPLPCGPVGDRLATHGWLPAQARVVASVDLDHADTPTAIEQLSEHARGADHGLPIDVAFALGQWGWQIPLLLRTLHDAGFEPGEVAYVRLASGSSAWVWATRCDFDEATRRVAAAWGVQVRRTAGGAVGAAPADADGVVAFAYDVVFLPADRAALVPAGGATEFVRALTSRPDPPAPDATPPGVLLDGLAAAPVRLVVKGEALLAEGGGPPRRALTVDATGVTAASLPDQHE